MTFTTPTFLLFLVVVFTVYWMTPRRGLQNVLLVAASYVFYGWWDWRFCIMMAASTCVDYTVSRALDITQSLTRRRLLLMTSLLFNLGLLGFFKYFNFFTDTFAEAMASLGWHTHPVTLRIILPVGISFYTFQTMGYTIDVYMRRMAPVKHLSDYLAFVSFFPQLVAGPIERATQLLPQFLHPRRFNLDDATDGCRQILWGFFKKMVIADNLAPLVDAAYTTPGDYSGLRLALATVFFAFQIYCDFSAYSDIAIGTARLFGFRIMRNFAYPYFSQSVGEFWRRWHISLSTWFRDYVFIPLGGSRGTRGRTAFNLLATFTVSGLWHGASWNFVIWGFINGLAALPSVLVPYGQKKRAADHPGGSSIFPRPAVIGWMALTFLLICITWVFFRAPTFDVATQILARVFAGPWGGGSGLRSDVSLPERPMLLILACFVAVEWVQRHHPHPMHVESLPRTVRWVLYTALLWLTFLLMPRQSSPFIYFQF